MKLLVVMQHQNFFRNLETVVRELNERGHEVVMYHGTRPDSKNKKKAKMPFQGRGIEEAAEEFGFATGYRPEPPEKRQVRLRKGRAVINRGIYFQKDHPSPDRVVEGLEKQLPKSLHKRINSRLGRTLLGRPGSLRAWRMFERLGQPSAKLTELLREINPDVVLVSPTVWPKAPVEADYIFAARKLGIPTIGYLNSWDNLTSKGTVHVLPDVYVVWNEALAGEAEEIHHIPREIIRVTGAPHTDHFFDMTPSADHAETATRMGAPADRSYIVYLCSSRTLIQDETPIVSELADALKEKLGEKAPTLVVRPHPVNADPWDGYQHDGVAIYPRLGDQADTPSSWQDYFDQLHHASAFVGLNTTAFLEAAVADRPCLTIVSDRFYEQQGHTGHFRHLLAADFLEVSSDVREVAGRVERVLGGVDEKAAGRRRFVADFLRPRGIERPAHEVVVDLIEDVGMPDGSASVPPRSETREPVAAAAPGTEA